MHSAKQGVVKLADACISMGLNTFVFSPGSRNAPLIIEFANRENVTCYVVPDERCAAFVALGIAQQTQNPVGICCTSGSAVLNYAPAIAEAYYQRIPLIALTADRPSNLIDQADGQSIRQANVFANYIKSSYNLSDDLCDENVDQTIAEGIALAMSNHKGPVHFNLPFTEPLYKTTENHVPVNTAVESGAGTHAEIEDQLLELWQNSSKKLILCGQLLPDEKLQYRLEQLASDPSVAIVTENTSNLAGVKFNTCIDRLISSFSEEETGEFIPYLLVTIGENIVSKKIKELFRKHQPKNHWNINPTPEHPDTFGVRTLEINTTAIEFLKQLLDKTEPTQSNFASKWKQRDFETEEKHVAFLNQAEYSDLKVFELLLDVIPAHSHLQLANSTTIRYAQLFNAQPDIRYFGNRGVSGIDGCTSTAIGAAIASKELTTLISGDMAFLYDSNALWNKHLPDNLRIVLINNGGGGIFRFIPGPGETPQLEEFFEAHHHLNSEHICKTFNVPYYSAESLNEIEATIPDFYAPQENNRPAVLEIHTPREKNDIILKEYFKTIAS